MRTLERHLRARGCQRIAGVDEAGRGPLAGPVVAAACVIPEEVEILGVDDSKKLTRVKRLALFEQLRSFAEVAIGVGIVDAASIDVLNIYQATIKAMHLALEDLNPQPDYVIVDGHPIRHPRLQVQGVIGGDAQCYSIAAASIIAKETRDRLMEQFHEQWPEYGFAQHKGYGTPAHLEALQRYGPCPIHRRSFKLNNHISE